MFVSEPLRPDGKDFDTGSMSGGAPGLPAAFLWKKERFEIRTVLRSWKDTAPCRNGSGERYVNKHWFECGVEPGGRAVLYFERRKRPGTPATRRWYLYTLGD